MFQRKKLLSILMILSFFTIFFIMNTKIEAQSSPSSPHFTGYYEGDARLFYFKEDWAWPDIMDGKNNSAVFDPNSTNAQGYVFSANLLDITADGLVNGSGVQIIANNESAQENISNAYRVAQEFSVEDLCTITSYKLYLNYSVKATFTSPVTLKTSIMEADLTTTVVDYEWYIYSDDTRTGWQWFNFGPHVLEPMTVYFLVFEIFRGLASEVGFGGPSAIPVLTGNFSWKAQRHNATEYNIGQTMAYNGSVWENITDDGIRDMLCQFWYDIVIDPYTLDLQITINDVPIGWQRGSPEWGSGYQIHATNYFPEAMNNTINVTISVNTTIPTLWVEAIMSYVFRISVIGTFDASSTQIEWSVIYPFRNVEGTVWPAGEMFGFEPDWNYIDIQDSDNVSVDNVFFGPITVFNQPYFAALLEFPWGRPSP